MEVKKVHRAWIEVKGQTINALAIASQVKLSNEELSLTFKLNERCAEINAIAIGKDYRIDDNLRFTEILECTTKTRNGRLKDSRGESDFQIIEEELSQAIAYYLNDSAGKTGEGAGLQIVPHRDDVTDDDQIAINSLGRVYLSGNLKDKTIKVRTAVIYKRVVTVLDEPIKDVRSHLVCTWADDSLKYLQIDGEIQTGVTFAPKNQMRTVKIDVSEIRVPI